ncbi:hypothetical protein H2O64_09495 [Kordia sp. YSTF-M3]|uniref:Uncharacterized protein n=1 Tax=Kordia aestuariivivens TaxID=2759037 RepID=A0ABR7Q8T0_9FLAO|nr:hypothetical protein [Kordia aestuariivivens]MBC8754903.1 hypothetical protein [Kordia aestuariivivens]
MKVSNLTETSKEKILDEPLKEEVLAVHVELETLKLARKGILKDAAVLGTIAIIVILVGLYAQSVEWTEFPIFQATIAAGGILLAIAFRPLQHYKKQLAAAEEKQKDLETILKKDNLEYKADVRITRDVKGVFDIKKSIKLFTIK